MSDFVIHSIPGSPFGRAVLATLEEKGARYRFAAVHPGTLKAEPHLSRHPFGKVPVLEHGDFKLYETQAILRYLDRVSALARFNASGRSLGGADGSGDGRERLVPVPRRRQHHRLSARRRADHHGADPR